MGWSRKRVVCTFNRIASEHMKSSISRKSGFFLENLGLHLGMLPFQVYLFLIRNSYLFQCKLEKRKCISKYHREREREKTKHEIKKLNPFAQPSIHLNQPQSSESTRDHVAYALHQTIPHEMLCGYIFTMPVLSRNE